MCIEDDALVNAEGCPKPTRLFNSAKTLRMKTPFSKDEVIEAQKAVVCLSMENLAGLNQRALNLTFASPDQNF